MLVSNFFNLAKYYLPVIYTNLHCASENRQLLSFFFFDLFC